MIGGLRNCEIEVVDCTKVDEKRVADIKHNQFMAPFRLDNCHSAEKLRKMQMSSIGNPAFLLVSDSLFEHGSH